jgi:hypothetical protein
VKRACKSASDVLEEIRSARNDAGDRADSVKTGSEGAR